MPRELCSSIAQKYQLAWTLCRAQSVLLTAASCLRRPPLKEQEDLPFWHICA